MNFERWKDAAELLGIAAIVASLVFVGLQMKQSHQIAQAEIYQNRTATLADAITSMASNPYLLAAFSKGAEGRFADIEPTEYLAVEWIVLADLMLNENSFYQYSLGFLPEEHWRRVRSNIRIALQHPLEGPAIRKMKVAMGDPFRGVLEEIDRELGVE